MTRIHVKYKPNPEYHDEDAWYLTNDYIFDVEKLRAFVASPETDDYTYSLNEAEQILSRYDTESLIYGLESHDKFSFFDTDWERKEVLSEDQETPVEYEITILLNT